MRLLASVASYNASYGLANPPLAAGAPKGSVKIANDGSVAMLLPTQRAVSWQITDSKGKFVVRERNWLTLQPG